MIINYLIRKPLHEIQTFNINNDNRSRNLHTYKFYYKIKFLSLDFGSKLINGEAHSNKSKLTQNQLN